ncbi:DUF2851 family protein [Niabella yanshanensis]|uniref:DUF2851 family protein n=1 Tax=Niabella yanshanensis TaxID=577386 RepID=A0ABZ0W855_9BACT|nr:DUF2851 family protein [Niabella yanshanensis]WQD39331.1 DUF2851 family protein [Niabella yanshanensis]
MNENLLQFIWRFQYFNKLNLFTVQGDPVEVIHPGTLNTNQGPDFSNAKVKIGRTLWAGTVELHIKTSDWLKHGHSRDDNYKNVILHVVYEDDVTGNNLPVLELSGLIPGILIRRYNSLMMSQRFIACEGLIHKVDRLIISSWKDRLVAERLHRKATLIDDYLSRNKQHWEESFWWLLARNFGTKTNAETFEAIAKSISVKLLARHKTNLIQLEAILLGQAGLLNRAKYQDKYVLLLDKEYNFLKIKYKLRPVVFPIHFLRMRPGNFPTIRLAQLAALIHNSAHLFSRIVEEPELAVVKKWFEVAPNDFWNYHYTLIDDPKFLKKAIGEDMVNNLIINTVVPMLFAYGNKHHKGDTKEKALQWLEAVGAEKNSITRGFQQLGVLNKNAYDSQALVELKAQYCSLRKCLNCAIGNAVIKNK